MNYYNENNPEAAEWLRELIKSGEIPLGDVDERSIEEVRPHEIDHYTQHHFFAGIGGWALALRLAGWPDHRPVRTASCPCQPFSQTGKQLGFADKRHLWPVLFELIKGHGGGIAITFGEQVASPLGREWLAGVRTDMEGVDHEVGSADLCAAGIGAPHIRQRLYWVAYAKHGDGRGEQQSGESRKNGRAGFAGSGTTHRIGSGQDATGAAIGIGRLADARKSERGWRSDREWNECDGGNIGRSETPSDVKSCGDVCRMVNAGAEGLEEQRGDFGIPSFAREAIERTGPPTGAWDNFNIVHCRDGKARRFEPGSFPLAHGVSGRVGLLRGYGNAIVPQLAAEFIRAAVEAIEDGSKTITGLTKE